jgi:hypothetical protein
VPPRAYDLLGDDAVLDDLAVVVDVVDEQVECPDALPEAALDGAPVLRLDDARDDVEGEDPFLPLVVAVDVEGDPEIEEGGFGSTLPAEQLPLRKRLDAPDEQRGARTRFRPPAEEGLVVVALGVVSLEAQNRPPPNRAWSGDAPPRRHKSTSLQVPDRDAPHPGGGSAG